MGFKVIPVPGLRERVGEGREEEEREGEEGEGREGRGKCGYRIERMKKGGRRRR